MLLMLLDTATPTDPPATQLADVFQLITVLLVMVLIVVAAWFVTRWIAGGTFRMQKQLARMQIVDRLMIAKDRAVIVVELGGRYYMMGVGTTISMLGEVDGAPYRAASSEAPQGGGFFAALQDKLRARQGYQPYEGPVGPGDDMPDTRQEEMERAAERMRERARRRRSSRDDEGDEDE